MRAASVANLITGLDELRLIEPKTSNPDLYPRIGLEDPNAKGAESNLVALERGATSLGELIVGKKAESIGFDPLGGTFVRRPGDAQSWLAQGSPTIPSELSGWFDELPAYPSVDVARVQVSDGGKIVFDAVKDGDVYKPAPAAAGDTNPMTNQVNDAAVKQLAYVVSTGTFEDVAAADKVSFTAMPPAWSISSLPMAYRSTSRSVTRTARNGCATCRTAKPDPSAATQVHDFADRGKSFALCAARIPTFGADDRRR